MPVDAAPVSKELYYSPDPTVRQTVWAQLYTEKATAILRSVRRLVPWLEPDDALSAVNDAFLAAQKYRPLNGEFNPANLVTHIAWKKAQSLFRRKMARKRSSKIPPVVLDAVSPNPETDIAVYDPLPDIGVTKEINIRIDQFPRLQRAVSLAMIDSPGSSASELAEEIAFELGEKPTTGAVESARKVVRKKLLPYVTEIRRELLR